METALISKKELLQTMNISYGQLYRWKRKKLIPEEWFIKKSVSTGQETFFPREQVLERISKIIELKDQVSLDALSDVFSPKDEEISLELERLLDKQIITLQGVALFERMLEGSADLSDLKQVLMVKIVDHQVVSGNLTFDEGKLLWQFLDKHYQRLNREESCLLLIRHLGLPFVVGALNREMVIIDEGDKVVLEVELLKEIGKIKLALLG